MHVQVATCYVITKKVPKISLARVSGEFVLKCKKSKALDGLMDKAKKKKMLCCPLLTGRKMRKNRVGFFFFFFFFFMSDLGEEFAKICIQWLKKALA